MAVLQRFLEENNLDNLSKLYIKVNYHNKLPLAILTYNNILSPKNNPIVSLCRGLVIELNTWKIVSQGMIRFDNFNLNTKTVITDAMIKEDGTLLHLFCYNDQWMIATRHNFGEDYVNNDRKQTYQELFEQICGNSLQEIGSKLNPNLTYCLEMCSIFNRIIRKYNVPCLYLLTCYENGNELETEQIDLEAKKANWLRPNNFKVKDINKCYELLEQQSLLDPLFEGFVLRDSNKNRYKLKNQFYLQIHKLKYRGWKLATPENIVPLILYHQDKLDLIYEALEHHHTKWDLIEYKKRFEHYKTKLEQLNANISSLTVKKYIDIYTNNDPFIDAKHDKKYCTHNMKNKFNDHNNGLALNHPKYEDNKWNVECYCGTKMYLYRTKTDYLIYNHCIACNCDFDIKVYPVGTLIWLCSNCPLTHDAHQNNANYDGMEILQGQPTGIPCSANCKNLRLSIHQMFNNIQTTKKITKNQTYQLLAKLLGIPKKSTHMALFDIPTCLKAIELLHNQTFLL